MRLLRSEQHLQKESKGSRRLKKKTLAKLFQIGFQMLQKSTFCTSQSRPISSFNLRKRWKNLPHMAVFKTFFPINKMSILGIKGVCASLPEVWPKTAPPGPWPNSSTFGEKNASFKYHGGRKGINKKTVIYVYSKNVSYTYVHICIYSYTGIWLVYHGPTTKRK